MTDIVSHIKECCPPEDHDLNTAEGRWGWDQALRAELAKVEPEGLRRHASQLVKEWRWSVLQPKSNQTFHTSDVDPY